MKLDLTPGTDITAVLQSALSLGADVDLPAGTFICDAVTLTAAGQRVTGRGRHTILRQKTAGHHMFIVQGTGARIEGLRLEGIESAHATSFAVYTAIANPALGLELEGLTISGQDGSKGFGNGIKLDNACDDGLVRDCLIENLWGGTVGDGYGVLVAGNSFRVLSCWINQALERGRHGVYVSAGASDGVVRGNRVTGSTYEAIPVYATPAQSPCARNVIDDNHLIGCVTATNPASGAVGLYGNCMDNRISRNLIRSSGQKGIALDGTGAGGLLLRPLIEANDIMSSGTNGIDVIAAADATLRGNTIRDSSQNAADISANIRLVSDNIIGCTNTFLEGNRTSGGRSAFQINPSTPVPTNTNLKGNLFSAGTIAAIEANGVSFSVDTVP